MEAIRRLVGVPAARSPPPRVETDDIYPLHMLDDTKTLRGIVVTWTLRFDDVLDPEKLHKSLIRLLEIGDWRKIGGRLRMKEDGGLEIHVPQAFTTERPALSYSHEHIYSNIADHSVGKTLPKATDGPSIQSGPQCFRSFAAREGAPAALDDFIFSDIPQLSLHITSFNDATLIGLSWPHTLMDVMGQQALLQGWSLVLAGRASDVPQVLGAREDVICAAQSGHEEKEEFKLRDKVMGGWGLVTFGVRFALDMMRNPAVETRTIFLPQRAIKKLRQEAESDLAHSDSDKPPFVSDGDILTAWATRAVASSLPQPRPVTVLHALNLRFRLPSLIEAPGVFIQNMAIAAYTFLPADCATSPLGQIALENRHHLLDQSTEGQVLAFMEELSKDSKGDPRVLCGDSNALLLPLTNWDRANIFKTADFSSAILTSANVASRSSPPGTITYHHADSMQQNSAARNVVVVLGKDHSDNYWITGVQLTPLTWDKIAEDIARL
ncbi:BCL5p [Colletotrichum truncatum]|uniref:BCL5p n=1 Tax=Colletotrichum truncatum TaxID=5467 RepID=A0ACC3YJP6_COLTU|nr:BCL5p [Colletotrichum truncatum]KAF6797375.1 BCL5p [Colletotrichum truncatum]